MIFFVNIEKVTIRTELRCFLAYLAPDVLFYIYKVIILGYRGREQLVSKDMKL